MKRMNEIDRNKDTNCPWTEMETMTKQHTTIYEQIVKQSRLSAEVFKEEKVENCARTKY